jgi:hypothetical protein
VLKRYAVATLLILILAISLAVYLSTQKPSDDNFNLADDFNLVLKYGVGAKNELNTFDATFTKDLILDPPVTTKLGITSQEKMQILERIDEMDLFGFPNNFPMNPHAWTTPQMDYYIKVQNGSQVKEITWNSNSLIESDVKNGLDQVVSYIICLIEQKSEYKELPNPNGGYL